MPHAARFLESLCFSMGCQYLSDLRYLTSDQLCQLAAIVEQIPPDTITLAEWNDALRYLTNSPCEQTDGAAKQALLQQLLQACTHQP